jgi:transposase
VAGAELRPLARSAAGVREVEFGSFAVPAMDAVGRLGESFQCLGRRPGLRIRHDRRHDLEGPCRRGGRKRGAQAHGIGRSKGGLTTKIHASVDALGNPLRIEISPGQAHDSLFAEALLEGFDAADYVLADCAYDADRIRAIIDEDLCAVAVIPSNPSRAGAIPMDREIYKARHLIECFFNKIKRYRRIALRCEKTLASFRAFVMIACTMTWLA